MANVAFSFDNVSVHDQKGSAAVYGVSGYTVPGGITAVLGSSGSGKSILLKAIAGRIGQEEGLDITTGKLSLFGKALSSATQSKQLKYCPTTNDHLVGVLTVKEHIMFATKMANSGDPNFNHEAFCEEIMQRMDLKKVENTRIGTIYARGISGGQQRRVCTAVDLAANPTVMLLDEPTSGLDTTTAIGNLTFIKERVAERGRSAIITMHQPNNALLDLCSHVLLLVEGKTVFFGTVPEAREHFASINHPAPESLASPPTEAFLRFTDPVFSDVEMNWADAYSQSQFGVTTRQTIAQHQAGQGETNPDAFKTNFASTGTQVVECFKRDFTIGKRDLTLFYLQYALQIMYGMLVGFIFLNIEWSLDDSNLPLGYSLITWATALNVYVFVFKAMYFNDTYIRSGHERANHVYGIIPAWIADLGVNLIMAIGYFAGTIISWFIIGANAEGDQKGFDNETFPFILLLAYIATFASENLPDLVVQFTGPNVALGFISVQGALLILFMFSGGTFIRDDAVPDGWKWLKAISPFEHATDTFMAAAYDPIEFSCPEGSIFPRDNIINNGTVTIDAYRKSLPYGKGLFDDSNYVCSFDYGIFPCDANDPNATEFNKDWDDTSESWIGTVTGRGCLAHGTSVTTIYKTQVLDKWESLGWLALFGVLCRLCTLFFKIVQPSRIRHSIQSAFASPPGTTRLDVLHKCSGHSGARIPDTDKADLIMEGIKVTLKKKDKNNLFFPYKVLVKEMFATCKGGSITALMGPSGAGKTTLLNAISGMAPYATVDGSVKLGGGALTKDLLSYVPQFDHLIEAFTVRETLLYSVMLKVQRDSKEVQREIAELAELLGFASVLDVRVGKIAMGQKKLVSIGIGLITHPRALFLDEPTTGLDSTAAHFVVEHIKEVAKTGVTVIMTIHQPSAEVFDMLDDIILLDSQGNLAFAGPIPLAIGYFGDAGFVTKPNDNPADVFLDATSAPGPRDGGIPEWAQFYDVNPAKAMAMQTLEESKAKMGSGASSQYTQPGEFARFRMLVQKLSMQYWRTPGAYLYRLVTIIIFGFFAGTLYFDLEPSTESMTEITGVIFFGLWCSLYLVLGNIPIFLEDRYDSVNNYASGRHSFGVYCIAQFVASIPWQLMCATAFTTLIYWMPFYNWQISEDPDAFIFAILTSFIMMICMEGFNWMMIELLQSDMLAVTASMTMLGTFFMFAGFFIKIQDIPWGVRWMSYTVPTKYVFAGHMFNFFDGQTFTLPDGTTQEGAYLAESLFNIDYRKHDSYRKWMDLLIGFAFALNFRSSHHMLLKMKNGNLGAELPESKSGTATWTRPADAHDRVPESIETKALSAQAVRAPAAVAAPAPQRSRSSNMPGLYPTITDVTMV